VNVLRFHVGQSKETVVIYSGLPFQWKIKIPNTMRTIYSYILINMFLTQIVYLRVTDLNVKSN